MSSLIGKGKPNTTSDVGVYHTIKTQLINHTNNTFPYAQCIGTWMDFDQQQRDLYSSIICVHTCIVVHTYIWHFLGIANEWRKNFEQINHCLAKSVPWEYSAQILHTNTLSDAPHVAVRDDRARRPRLYLFSCAYLSKACKLVWCYTIVSVSNRF